MSRKWSQTGVQAQVKATLRLFTKELIKSGSTYLAMIHRISQFFGFNQRQIGKARVLLDVTGLTHNLAFLTAFFLMPNC